MLVVHSCLEVLGVIAGACPSFLQRTVFVGKELAACPTCLASPRGGASFSQRRETLAVLLLTCLLICLCVDIVSVFDSRAS